MRVPRDNNRRILGLARGLRKSSTDAEAKLWSLLRSRSLAGYKFRRQHPVGGYILDFYCIRHKLAIELDGSQHTKPTSAAYDAKRTRRLDDLGVRVLRFWNHDLLRDTDVVAEHILRYLNGEAEPSPQPSPGVPGEGEAG